MEENALGQRLSNNTPILEKKIKFSKKGNLKFLLFEVKYPLPRIEEILANLKGAKYFSKVDFSSAYLQLLLKEEIQNTIMTPKGLFDFCRLLFGLSVSAPIFQRTMASVFQGLERVFYYMDDVLVTGVTPEQHNQRLDKRIRDKDLRASKEKSVFGVKLST
ncbi:unnamed protein product [Gordionus sp. m RMFG-2023]